MKDPLLVVWKAMNLLAKVDICPDEPKVWKLITEAEEAMLRLTIELARRTEFGEPISEPINVCH